MQIELKTITPEVAKFILESNKINRRLNPQTVELYSRQMINNEWQLNGEAIKISEDGTLLDGQHRLSAIVKSDKSIPMFVVTGVAQEAIKTLDTGKPRSLANHLSIHGYSGPTAVIAAAILFVKKFKDGVYTGHKEKSTPTEIIDFLEKHNELLLFAQRYYYKGAKVLPASISVALGYLFSKIDAQRSEEFFAQLFSGSNLEADSPVLVLRNKLLTMKGESKKAQYDRKILCAFVVKAFTAFLNNEKIVRLRYDEGTDIILPTAKEEK